MLFLKENIDALGQRVLKVGDFFFICMISPYVSFKAVILSLNIGLGMKTSKRLFNLFGPICHILVIFLFHFLRKEYISTDRTPFFCSVMCCSVLSHDEAHENPGSSCPLPAQKNTHFV